MLTHTNIDRADSKQVSKAPFTFTSTLNLAGRELPTGSFISLRLYVEEGTNVPYRIHSIQQDGRVIFCDSTGTPVAYWQTYPETEQVINDIPYISSLLFNMNGVIAGHVACTHTVISVIRSVIESLTGAYMVPADAFVLIPQCHVAMMQGVCRSIGLVSKDKTTYVTGDITIGVSGAQDQECILVDADALASAGILQVNLTNTEDTIAEQAPVNGICAITINGSTETFDCEDNSIIFKAGAESNLRVVKEQNRLNLKGVKNA